MSRSMCPWRTLMGVAGVGAFSCGSLLAAEYPKAVTDPAFKNLASAPEVKDGSGEWEGSLGLGLTMRRGGTTSNQGSVTFDASRTMQESRLLGRLVAVRSADGDNRNADSVEGEFRGERNFSERLFGFSGLGLERDTAQDMTARQTFNSGVGTYWLKTKTLSLNLYGGLAYSVERNRAAGTDKGAEFLMGSELHYDLSPTSRLTHRFVAYPDSISGGARYAMQGDLTTRINERFGLQVAALQKYREKVREGNAHNDTVLFTGITSSF